MSRTRPLVVLALAAALLIQGMPASPVLASDIVSTVTDAAAQAAAASDTQRFIALWTERFHDPGFQAYVDSDVTYDDGFNDWSADRQHGLVEALVDYWRDNVPNVAAEMAATESDPDQMHHADVVNWLELLIFHKQELKATLANPDSRPLLPDPLGRTADETVDGAPATPEEPAVPLAYGDEAVRELKDSLAAVGAAVEHAVDAVLAAVGDAVPRDLPTVDAPAVDVVTPPTSLPDHVARIEALDAAVAELSRLVPVRKVIAPLKVTSMQPLDLVTDPPLMFRGCYRNGSATPVCATPLPYSISAAGIVSAAPQVGVPALFNTDGNLLTGPAGNDLKISVAIEPGTAVGSVAVITTVERLSTAATNLLGYAVLRLGSTSNIATAGFDGRVDGLQATQQARIEITDLTGSSPAANDLRVVLTHGGPASTRLHLVADVSDENTGPKVSATIGLVRAPSPLTATYTSSRSNGASHLQVALTHGIASTDPNVLPDLTGAVAMHKGGGLTEATLGIAALPATTTVTVDSGADNSVTLNSATSSTIATLDATYRNVPNAASAGDDLAVAAHLAAVPRHVTLVVDERTDDLTASSAPLPIGTSSGNAAPTLPDPATAYPVSPAQTAPRRTVTWTADADVLSQGATPALSFDAYQRQAGVKTWDAYGTLSQIPHAWQLRLPARTYRTATSTASGPIAKLTGGYRTANVAIDATVLDVPSVFSLTLPASNSATTAWSASDTTTKVTAQAQIGATSLDATVDALPSSWSVRLADSGPVFAASAPIGLIDVKVSNTGSYPAALSTPNYAVAQVTTLASGRTSAAEPSPILVDYAAALRIAGAKLAKVQRSGATTSFDVQLGAGQDFAASVRVRNLKQSTRLYADLSARPFPGRIYGTVGDVNDVTSSANTDLQLYAEAGDEAAAAATPAPPVVHGLAYRDGIANGKTAQKVYLRLTGLPTHAHFGADGLAVDNFAPTISTVSLDYVRDNDPNNVLELVVALTGVGGSGPLSFGYGVTKPDSTTTVTTANVNAGVTLGAVSGWYRTNGLKVTLSTTALPGQVSYSMTEKEGQYTVEYSANAGVDRITVGVQYQKPGQTAFTARGAVELTNLPKRVSLTLGRDASGAGPLLSYDSHEPNPTRRLGVHAAADGSLTSANAVVSAMFTIDVVDLPSAFTVAKSGSTLQFTTTGAALTSFDAWVSGRAAYNASGNTNEARFGWFGVWAGWSLTVNAVVDMFRVRATQVTSLSVQPGVVTSIAGTYGAFRLAWDRFQTGGRATAGIYGAVHWPRWARWLGAPSQTDLTVVQISVQVPNVNALRFHTFTPTWTRIFDVGIGFGYHAWVDIRPSSAGIQYGLASAGGLNLGGTTGYHSNLVMPDPFNLSVVTGTIIAGIVTYGGGFISAGVS